MNYKMAFAAMTALLAGTIFAQQTISVSEKEYTGWGADRLEYNKQALIVGPKNTYGFNLCMRKPEANGETTLYMVLTEPRRQGGFGQHSCRFLTIDVNGIPLTQLSPNDKTFQLVTEPNSTGAKLLFNFDGAKIVMDVFMRENSPLLFLRFRPDPTSVEPFKKCEIKFQVQVGGVNGDPNVKNTFLQTASREIAGSTVPNKAKVFLSAEDKYLIFKDNVYDGSGKGKGYGPSYLLLPSDFSQLESADVWLMNQPLSLITLRLKPDFKEVTVGILQDKTVRSNETFMKYFEANNAELTTF